MLTRDQRYAADIYRRVTAFRDAAAHDQQLDVNQYGGLAHSLPALVRSAGLAQALAFVESRKKKSLDRLLDDLAGTLELQDRTALLESSRSVSLPEYIRLTERVIDALNWYKRFAQTILNVQPGVSLSDSGAQP